MVAEAAARFDDRAVAIVRAAVGTINIDAMQFIPSNKPGGGHFVRVDRFAELLEVKSFGDLAEDVIIPKAQCLAVIAYPDFPRAFTMITHGAWCLRHFCCVTFF